MPTAKAIPKLTWKDVSVQTFGGASADSGNFARSSQMRSYRIHMCHLPTSVMVSGETGLMSLTKEQWKAKKQELQDILWVRLQLEVEIRYRKALQ